MSVAIAIAVALVLLICAAVALRRLNRSFDSIDFGSGAATAPDAPPEPWERPFRPTGDPDLPYSIRLRGTIYRWQARERVVDGDRFYAMFEDGPWKWAAQGRFAGKGINCGHYFGLSVDAATEEAQHYGIDTTGGVLLAVEGASRRILDLTHPDVIRAQFERYVDNHQLVTRSYYTMLSELVERGNGGNVITDYLGYQASREGYDGILFFSARVLHQADIDRMDRDLEGYSAGPWFYERRKDPRLLNVVIFSGATLLSRLSRCRVGEAEPIANPHGGKPPSEIARLFQFDEQFQEQQRRFVLGRPRYEPLDSR